MQEELDRIRENMQFEKNKAKKFLMLDTYLGLLSEYDIDKYIEESADARIKFGVEIKELNNNFIIDAKDTHKLIDKRLNKIFKKNNYHNYELQASNKLKLEEAYDILSCFMNDTGEEYYKLFQELLEKEEIFHYDRDLDYDLGFSINGTGVNKNYLFINRNINTIVPYVTTFSHEFGHVYEEKFMSTMSSKQQVYKMYSYFYEVYSQFLERLMLDYLINNGLYVDDVNRELNFYYSDLKTCFELSNEEVNVLEDMKTRKEETPLNSHCEVLIESVHNDWLVYGYGKIISEYFFDIYKKDKKEGLKLIRDFVSKQYLSNEMKLLNEFDFTNNNFKFIENGINYNSKYMRKKYNW